MPTPGRALVPAMQRLEQSPSLDGLRAAYGKVAGPVDRWSGSELLRSGLIGHALHPLLTDVPLGCWTAATILDVRGRPADRGASRLLVGVGLVAVAPTALTGLAEWARTGREAQRVGALHGVLNVVAASLYASSYVARTRGRHGLGTVTALVGACLTGASGYLGGHLTTARRVASRDPAFAHEGGSDHEPLTAGPGAIVDP